MGSEISCPIGLCSSLVSQVSPVGSWVFTGLAGPGKAGAKLTTGALLFCTALHASRMGDGQEGFSEKQQATCWPSEDLAGRGCLAPGCCQPCLDPCAGGREGTGLVDSWDPHCRSPPPPATFLQTSA